MSTCNKKVIVTNIAAKASEKTVKDFFLFCGRIKDFELIKEESSDTQIAYVTFERETAAKTALMLSSALIGDSQIVVKPADEICSHEDSSDTEYLGDQESKPKSEVVAEILASGYLLQDAIIEKAFKYDAKYGLSDRLKQYLEQIHENLHHINNKYNVTTVACDIDNKYSFSDNAKQIYNQAYDRINKFCESPTGKKIVEYIFHTQKQVADVQSMARRKADEKKQDKNYVDPAPSHSHPDVQASSQPISG